MSHALQPPHAETVFSELLRCIRWEIRYNFSAVAKREQLTREQYLELWMRRGFQLAFPWGTITRFPGVLSEDDLSRLYP